VKAPGMEHAFGTGEPFTVGIEEELFLVDARTRDLVHDAERVVEAMGMPSELAGHEAPAAEIELRSPPAASASEAVDFLDRGRRIARRAGATLLGAGLHPNARLGDVRLVDLERYRTVGGEMRGLIHRTPECALHVHVGMPDAGAAIRAFNGLRAWLPLLQGLTANSAFWFGSDSGMASARWAHIRPYPGRGVPRAVTGLDDYAEAISDVALGGGPQDYTLVWWDVRPHPKLGTVEVREMDAQSRLGDVAAIAALIQGLARHAAEKASDPVPTEAIAWSVFRAARDGLEAEILHEGRLAPLRTVARAAAALALPHMSDGGSGALGWIERILREGGGADRQREAHRRGGMEAVLDALVEETATGWP
jgi:carboxylate-amine ligase